MTNRLYVSFWDLCLDILPQGRFEHRAIGAGDASQMIRAARLSRLFIGGHGVAVVLRLTLAAEPGPDSVDVERSENRCTGRLAEHGI